MLASARSRAQATRAVVVSTLWIGLVTGLVEAGLSVAVMRAGRRPGSWWDLFAVSPAFDVLMYGAVGFFLLVLARARRWPVLPIVLPAYGFLTASIWLGILLPYQVHIVALLMLCAGLGYQASRLVLRRLDRALAFWERSLPLVASAAVAAALAIFVGRPGWERIELTRLPSAPTDAPDIVLVVIDALRADHLQAHGYPRDTSPTLTRLASEGASFRAAFSTSPYTGPSHASLLTGLYPSEHGLQWLDRRPVLTPEHRTLPTALSELGYRTTAVSANRFWFTREQGFGRDFHSFRGNYWTVGDALVRTAYGRKLREWVIPRLFEDYPWRMKANQVTDAALEWAAQDRERPMFLMLNYFDVHDPYLPPQPYRSRYSDEEEPGGILNTYLQRYHAELSPAELQAEIDAYDGAIRFVDDELQRLLAGLRSGRGTRDLIVVVTADHGEAFGEHGAFIHANSLYLEEIHVPLIVWAPGRVPSGLEIDVPVSNAAIPATLMSLAGGEPIPDAMVGPLTPLWSDEGEAPGRVPVFSEMERWEWNLETSPSHYGAIQSVVVDELHLISNDSLGTELYRWRDDPREEFDLVDRLARPRAVSRLERALRDRLPRPEAEAEGS